MCNTDRIRKLNFTFLCKTCCYHIFCNVTCCISCRTVYFCTVFSGESSTAVTSISTVSIYDNLTSCQTTVSVRSTDYETSCRVDEEFCIFIYHFCRKNRVKYIFFDIFMNLFLCYFRVMLCR